MLDKNILDYLEISGSGLSEEDVEAYKKENKIIEELMIDPKNLKGIYDKY